VIFTLRDCARNRFDFSSKAFVMVEGIPMRSHISKNLKNRLNFLDIKEDTMLPSMVAIFKDRNALTKRSAICKVSWYSVSWVLLSLRLNWESNVMAGYDFTLVTRDASAECMRCRGVCDDDGGIIFFGVVPPEFGVVDVDVDVDAGGGSCCFSLCFL
jgi:hypothetical protein